MEVFQHEQRRPRVGGVFQHGQQGIQHLDLAPVRGHVGDRRTGLRRDAQQIGNHRLGNRIAHAETGKHRLQPGAAGFGVVAAFEPGRSGELLDGRVQGAVAGIRTAIPDQLNVGQIGDMAPQFFDQAGFADAGLAAQQHRLTPAGARLGPYRAQLRQLVPAPHHRDRIAAGAGLKPADRRRGLDRLERRHRGWETLERNFAEVTVGELARRDGARRGGHEDGVGVCQGLQAGSDIGGFADDPAAATFPAADQLADHDQAGGDADTAAQHDTRRQSQTADSIAQFEGRVHGVRGIVLIGAGISEIGDHTVAHILHDLAAELGHDVVAGG